MGTFTCACGHVIRDTTYPTDGAGMLYWEKDQEAINVQVASAVRDFLAVRASYQRDWWLKSFFSSDYPVDLDDADIIDDIYSKFAFEYGLSVYQCPQCQRIYVQKSHLKIGGSGTKPSLIQHEEPLWIEKPSGS